MGGGGGTSWRRGTLRGIGEMTRCLPGRQGRRSKGKAFHSEEQQERRHRGRNCRSGGAGSSDYPGGIARVGTSGCGRRGRQRQDDEGN